jgi:CRISPR-associated protein Csd2
MSIIENRYDFALLFDCQDGNPNGDPDSDNTPRFDPETFQGLVSDVCLKRKIRDYVFYTKSDGKSAEPSFGIFVLSGNTLESNQRQPFESLTGNDKIEALGAKTKPTDIEKARQWMCKNFFDVRAFGAVMSTTEFNCGQVRGPVQLTFARSIDRVLTTEHTISRQAFTGEKDIKSGTGTLGRKHTVSYGLYLAHGFINPVFAAKTGFNDEDLKLLWKALANLFELDRSAARGMMSTRGLYIFKHDSKLGNAQAQRLFESIKVERKDGVESPRSFADYNVTVPEAGSLPQGITLIDGLA